uniref:Uncharacterized protein n=1 Tax=Zea mays TaxID=4577 RepID=A0A804PA08_MAIZE
MNEANKEIRRSNQSKQGERKSRTELIAGASWAWAGQGRQDYRERVDLGRGCALLEGVVVRRSPRHGPFLPSCRFLALLRSAPRSARRAGPTGRSSSLLGPRFLVYSSPTPT